MRRRSFVRSVLTGIAGSSVVLPLGTKEEPQIIKIDDNLSLSEYPEIDGYSSGIPEIDAITNGFHGGQLVCVGGPMEHINISFLFGMAVHLARKKVRVDYINTQSNFHEYDRKKNAFMDPELKKKFDTETREYLRLPHIDLGDPRNTDWKEYLQLAQERPPKVLIMDGVGYIEMFIKERQMLRQVKNLAVKMKFPAIVQAPRQSHTRSWKLRKDAVKLSDVGIILQPDFVCGYRNGSEATKQYIVLNCTVGASWCPCVKHAAYSSEVKLQFTGAYLNFKAI